MAPGVTRKPHDAGQHLGQSRIVAAGGNQKARGRTPARAVRRSWTREKGPNALSLRPIDEEADDGRNGRIQGGRHERFEVRDPIS